MKIYFAGSIRGGRDDKETYLQIINHLKQYGDVLTEHIGDASLTSFGEQGVTEEFIHDRDMDWLLSADLVVAEITNPSLGVGYEIGRALEHKKSILCLYREQEGKKVSAMIIGAKEITCKVYTTLEEARTVIDQHLN